MGVIQGAPAEDQWIGVSDPYGKLQQETTKSLKHRFFGFFFVGFTLDSLCTVSEDASAKELDDLAVVLQTFAST